MEEPRLVAQRACHTGRPRVLLAGSDEQVDRGAADFVPASPHSAAKTSSLLYARMFDALYDLPVVNLRTFMVYGPLQQEVSKLIPYVATSLLRGEAPRLTSGSQLVDWVYVDDVVDAYIAAALSDRLAGQTVPVGAGRLESIRTVVNLLVSFTDAEEVTPKSGAVPDRAREDVRGANVKSALELPGWEPRVALADGLRRTVHWFRECSALG